MFNKVLTTNYFIFEKINLVRFYMNCFTDTYYKTTNPKTEYKELFSISVGKSILFHTIIYIGFLYMLRFISNIKIIEEKHLFSLILVLFLIMIFGFLGRLMRAKSIYNKELEIHNDDEKALLETKKLIDTGYFTWFFCS